MHWILSGCTIYLLRLFVVYINLWTSYTVKCLHWKKETFPKWTGYGQTLETVINDMLLSVVLVTSRSSTSSSILVVVRVTSKRW